jgi:tellurite resistance protein TehA-like permease
MRNRFRVLAFDVLAPLAAILALVYLGVVLAWPLWWVSVCSVLCLLIVQGVVVNGVLFRRDGVTIGTDDDGPGLRLAVVGLTTVALTAAVVIGYTRWSASPAVPPRRRRPSPRRARTPTSTG